MDPEVRESLREKFRKALEAGDAEKLRREQKAEEAKRQRIADEVTKAIEEAIGEIPLARCLGHREVVIKTFPDPALLDDTLWVAELKAQMEALDIPLSIFCGESKVMDCTITEYRLVLP